MSNASEIRMYFKELLEDLEEHSRAELFSYAKQKNPEANYTEGMLTGALKTLVDGNVNYVCVSRGIYRLNTDTDLNNRNHVRTLIERYKEILKTTVEKMENEITVNPFMLLDVDENEASQMKKVKKCIDVIKSTIEYLNQSMN